MAQSTERVAADAAAGAVRQLTADNNTRATLTAAIGPTIGYYVARCKHGGYVVMVDGVIHSAHTSLVEAIEAMGSVAANQYGESALRPEGATDVTPPLADHQDEQIPPGVRPDLSHQSGGNVVEPRFGPRTRETVQLLLIAVAVGMHAIVGA